MPSFRFDRPTTRMGASGHQTVGNVKLKSRGEQKNVRADTSSGTAHYNIDRFNPVYDRLEQGSVLEDWVPRDAPGINMMFRRMHVRGAVEGPTIDIYSSLPWSEFDVGGIEDKTIRRFYEEAFSQFTPEFLTTIAKEFLVIGRFCASLVFNGNKGYWDQIEPHDPDFLDIRPVPFRGYNPLIDMRVSPAMREFLNSSDERVRRMRALLPPQYVDKFKGSQTIPLDQYSTLFLARKISPYDHVGTSMLTRVVGLWALEKALMDATVTAARRRTGSLLHITAGIDDLWEADDNELDQISNLFTQAEEDAVGGVIVTRTGITANEIKQGGQVWKMSDEWAFLTEAKMRALGVSDALLDGSATYSNMETARSLMIEQILVFRQQLTKALFGWMSEQLARAHGFVLDPKRANNKGQIRMGPTLREDPEITSSFDQLRRNPYASTYVSAAEDDFRARIRRSSIPMERALRIPVEQLIVPTIQYRKEMKPTQDAAYIELLEKMVEKGLPVPKRIWAAAGGYDLDAAIEMMEEDKELTKRIAEVTQEEEEMAPEGEEGGGDLGNAPTGEPNAPPGEGLKPLKDLMGPGGAPPDGEVSPEKPDEGGGKKDPVKNPAPPSEVKPKSNPMAKFVKNMPFWKDGEFLGMRRATAMAMADKVDRNLKDVIERGSAIHQIVRVTVPKKAHQPVALYFAARAGFDVGRIPDDTLKDIARAICESHATPKQIVQELANLAFITRKHQDTRSSEIASDSARRMSSTVAKRASEDLANLPNNSKHLIGGL